MELYEMYYSRSSENTYETHTRKKQANLLRAVADINSSPGKGTAITLLLNDLR